MIRMATDGDVAMMTPLVETVLHVGNCQISHTDGRHGLALARMGKTAQYVWQDAYDLLEQSVEFYARNRLAGEFPYTAFTAHVLQDYPLPFVRVQSTVRGKEPHMLGYVPWLNERVQELRSYEAAAREIAVRDPRRDEPGWMATIEERDPAKDWLDPAAWTVMVQVFKMRFQHRESGG